MAVGALTSLTLLLMSLSKIRTVFVLSNTHHPGNVGASARAMWTMNFEELILVSPHDPKVLNRKKTKDGASGALHVLKGAKQVDSLKEAIAGIDVICATGMPADMSQKRLEQRYFEPRHFFADILSEKITTEPVRSIAFVFGNERFGLTEEEFNMCQQTLGIPTNPVFGSLNLASAVQLIAYDWRQELGGYGDESSEVPSTLP